MSENNLHSDNKEIVKAAILKEYHANDIVLSELLSTIRVPNLSVEKIIEIYAELASEIDDDEIIRMNPDDGIRDYLNPNHMESNKETLVKTIVNTKYPNGIIHDADTILADIMDEITEGDGFEITGLGNDILSAWLKTVDKQPFEQLFYDLTDKTFDDYINRCLCTLPENKKENL